MKKGKMSGKCTLEKSNRKYLQNLVGKPEGRRHVRCRHILEDNIKICLKKERKSEDVDWIHLAESGVQ
jgi:hypothetical protein